MLKIFREYRTGQVHFVFDLDDTLADFTDSFCDFMHIHVMQCPPQVVAYGNDYNLMKPFEHTGLTAVEALKMYEASGTMHLMKPTKHVEVYKRACKDYGTYTTILTARGWMEHPVEAVKAWADHNKVPLPDAIKIVGLNESKADYVAGLKGDVVGVMDDNPKHLREFMENNPKDAVIYAAARPWNVDAPSHCRV